MKENQYFFKRHKIILSIILTAIFAGLCYVVMLLPKIPIPSLVGQPYVHFGNLVVIVVSIIFGGLTGGLAGAIGMGIYDLTTGYGIWTIKTIILKLGIGLVTGVVFKLVSKKDDVKLKIRMYIFGALFLFIGLFIAIIAFLQNGIIHVGSQEVAISWPLYVFCIILGIFLILAGILSSKKGNDMVKVLYASSWGVIFNICGELLGGFLKKLLQGQGLKVSIAMSIASIPATIINGTVAVLVVFLVFPGINKAIKQVRYVDDDITIDECND